MVWSFPNIWLLPVTVPQYVLPHSNGKNGSASAKKRAVLPVTVNAAIPSRTSTGDGTPTGNAISSVTTFTCTWLPIPIVTSLYFLFSRGPHAMICYPSCTLFFMNAYLPELRIEKLLLDSAHDAYAVYEYCKRKNIAPFIDLNPGHTGHFTYKDDFTIDNDGVPVCKMGLRMHKDGYEEHRAKYRCPKSNRKCGCFCEHPCSPAKYGRTVHIFTPDNPRLFNIPPRDSNAWKKEYDRRTSVERSNKREKEDYKLEYGRHRSTKMWYCRLYGIMMPGKCHPARHFKNHY